MEGFFFALILLAALGCGMMAGVFFAFSAFVMKALARLPAEQGVAAMQAINVAAVTPAFMVALFGTAVACGALAVFALFAWDEHFAPYLLLAGSALYLVGTILLTIGYHVPRNEALARVEPHSADAESHWTRYLSGWTAWNHVRTASSLAAAAMLTIALHVG
jgi:uncharacterized membrane protein